MNARCLFNAIPISTLFVLVALVSVAHAATTISTNIQTDGTLSVTGTSTLTSSVGVATTTPWGMLSVTGPNTSATSPAVVAADFNNSPLFSVFDNGSVGINTASPTSTLDVRVAPWAIQVGNGTVVNQVGGVNIVRSNASLRFAGFNLGALVFSGTADSFTSEQAGAEINSQTEGNGASETWQQDPSANLIFLTTLGGLSNGAQSPGPIERLRISAAGLIGVSNSSPSNQLDVNISSDATAKTSTFSTLNINNTATSTTNSINKTGITISSTGSWTGTNANNIGLYVSSVSGGTNNYAAIFNGGSVGVGSTTPVANFQVANGNATTTMEIGSAGENKGSCLKLYRTDGSAIYAYVAAGATTFTLSTTACANVSNF